MIGMAHFAGTAASLRIRRSGRPCSSHLIEATACRLSDARSTVASCSYAPLKIITSNRLSEKARLPDETLVAVPRDNSHGN